MAATEARYDFVELHGDINDITGVDFDLTLTNSRRMKAKEKRLGTFKIRSDNARTGLYGDHTNSRPITSLFGDAYDVTDCVVDDLHATPTPPSQPGRYNMGSFKTLRGWSDNANIHAYDVTDCVDDEGTGSSTNSRSMKWERNRLNSFRTWPVWSVQSPERLAEAGLFYSGLGDLVKCPFCHGILKSWTDWDIPLVEHSRHFPRCPFILGKDVGNVPISQNVRGFVNYAPTGNMHSGQSVQGFANYAPTGNIHTGQSVQGFANCAYIGNIATGQSVQQSSQAVNLLDFTRESNRLATFSKWPSNRTQTPETLARAGFYHIPCEEKIDRVQCAYCNGRLFNWDDQDDPWTEHARCFPNCPYVKLCVESPVLENLYQESEHRTNQPLQQPPLTPTNDDVISAMSSDAVMAVMEMGFTPDQVKKVLDKHFKSGKVLNLSAEQLASDILENEDSNVAISGSDVTCTNSRSRSRENFPLSQSNIVSQELNTQGTISVGKRTEGHTHKPKEQRSSSDKKSSEKRRGSDWKERYLCSVCSENQKMVTFLPCGHLTCCNSCAVTATVCPICVTPVTSYVRTYY